LGYVLGTLLYDLFIHKFDNESSVWYYVTVIVLAIIMAIVALWLHDHIIMLATSIVGSYACIRMIGEMTGKFPDETTVVQRIAAGDLDGMPWEVYLFMAAMVVLAIVGLIIQCWLKSKYPTDKKKQQEKDNEYYNMI